MIRPYRETPDGEAVRRVARVARNSPFVRQAGYTAFVSRLCTVTVTDPDGRRHGLDALADPTYDAAHLFVVEAKKDLARRNTQTHSSDRLRWLEMGSPALDWQKWDRADRVSVLPAPRPRMIVNSGGLCRHG